MIVSPETFQLFATVLVTCMSVGWFVVDSINMMRELRKPRAARTHDRIFGYSIGLLLAVIGQVGVLVFYYG